MASILIVDDELVLVQQLQTALKSADHEIRTAQTAAEGLSIARDDPPDLVLLDLRLPDGSGLDLLPQLKQIDPNLLVVLMTGYGSERDAIDAMRRGAADYLHKPLDVGELGLLIERLLTQRRRERELDYLRNRDCGALPAEIARAGAKEIFDQVSRLCDASLPPGSRPPILLRGEPGTGKRSIARAVHDSLGGGPFIQVDCAGRSSAELARDLFGTLESDGPARAGLLEAAEGGSLLISEIANIDAEVRKRIIHVLQTRRASRVGSSREREINVHLLGTTSQSNPDEKLLDQIGGLSFAVAPLRERREQIVELANLLAVAFGARFDGVERKFSANAEAFLFEYDWPGNLRELQTVVERAVILSGGPTIEPDVIAELLGADPTLPRDGRVVLPDGGIRLEDVERDLLQQALERTRGNQTRASHLLGLSRDTLRYRINKWGLDKRTDSP